jgi:replication factor C subunit 2/4
MSVAEVPTKKVKVQPWVEKYRPEKVDEVAHQDEVVLTLKKSIEIGNLPHLLFHGPPGTGKTTTILAVARALYGPELYRTRILELNASDERGIKVVRDKIKSFAQGAVGTQRTRFSYIF